jgi:hypothetical protein
MGGTGRKRACNLGGEAQGPVFRRYNGSEPVEEVDNKIAAEALNDLIDAYRARCLWFLRPDYYPATREERLRVLELIQRHGDREAFRKAGALRQWLSQSSSDASAG